MIRLGIQTFPKLGLKHAGKSQIQQIFPKTFNLQTTATSLEFTRTTSFFNKLNAEAIWKSLNTVSNAGKKRGRGKSITKKSMMNLNKGQIIGVGKENIRFPGLNSPIIQGQDVVKLEKMSPNPDYHKQLIAARGTILKKKRLVVHPLERGWSGRSTMGKSLGPPEVIENKEGFDSYVLEIKYLKLTHSKMGKVRSVGVFVAVGNKNGLIGISSAKGADMKSAIKKAQRKASRKLFSIKLEDKRTVNHDFYYQFGISKVFVQKKPPGFGLVCNRGIMVCCELLGIKDLYSKVEGSTNKQNVVKAFLLGLLEQKSYQKMAEENKLHLVEQMKETYMFPKVLASPSEVSLKKDHNLLYEQYVMNGKLPLTMEKKQVKSPLPSYVKFLKRTNYSRNHDQVKLKILAEFGQYKSYLSDIYPECRAPYLGNISKQSSTDGSEQ